MRWKQTKSFSCFLVLCPIYGLKKTAQTTEGGTVQPAERPQALQIPTLEVDLDGAMVPCRWTSGCALLYSFYVRSCQYMYKIYK